MILGAYKPPDQSKFVFLEGLSKSFSIYLDTYGNVILFVGFNMTPEEKNLQLFAVSFNLEHLIKKSTCFKGSASCIDFIITNGKAYLKKRNTYIRNCGISNFYKLTVVYLKSQILKLLQNESYTEI